MDNSLCNKQGCDAKSRTLNVSMQTEGGEARLSCLGAEREPQLLGRLGKQESRFPGVERCVDLGKFQTFYLLQDRENQWFYLWDEQTATLSLATESWTEAYQDWLHLQHAASPTPDQSMPLLSTTELQTYVTEHQTAATFGQLLYNRDRSLKGILNYLVQISDTMGLRWSGTSDDEPGFLVLEKLGRRQHRLAKWIEPQAPAQIMARLHGAIDTFHQRWPYSLYRFNSEHWARLVVTGQCASFQADEILSYWRQTDACGEGEAALPEIIEQNVAAATALKMTLDGIPFNPSVLQNTSRYSSRSLSQQLS